MEFKHIEYFIKASEYKSITQAAEALFISQQALSKCIQNLEAELGCRLFHRTSKGSILTDEGQLVYDRFSPIVRKFYRTGGEVTEMLNDKKTVTIANSPMLFGFLFPDVLYAFKEQYPNYELDILDRSDREVMQYVLDCPSHLGLIIEPEHWHGRQTQFTLIRTYRLQLCVHKDHPLSKRKSVRFGELKNEKFLLLDEQSYYPQIVKDKAAECGFEPNIAFRSADHHLLTSLANQNKGILINIPVPMTDLFKDLRFVPIEDEDMTFSIAFIYQDYEKLDKPQQRFVEFMREFERQDVYAQ
ncbi:MAG TPA: LysR family transcriptional regulator [Ruminococcus flavefaciens]|nr:LysR family transcriptional regulator [Ruminococcus flavefaciens]HQL99347.1 LysR family transcriptional regulator [Ruminococcus flavefaciens]